MKIKFKHVFVLLITLVLFTTTLTSVNAAVIWNTNSMQEVYNPIGNIYSYAPTVIKDGNTEHMWSCHNNDNNVIKDHIYYTKIENGTVVSSQSVLGPGPLGAWDSYHVCDPTIVQGSFQMNSVTYQYAMFYLGNDVNASYHNQIGVAFANNIEGPWVKYANPLITYPNDGFWGVGQPSATSIDGQGHILLFYTKGDSALTGGFRVELQLSNMSNPVVGTPLQLTNAGLLDINGNQDWFNNFDIVYDPTRDRFYAIRDQHPFPNSVPSYITSHIQVVSIPGANVWGGGGTWKVEASLGPSITGFDRNHNAGILRGWYGTLPASNQVDIYFTKANAEPNLTGLTEYTYDIWKINGQLNNNDMLTYQPLLSFQTPKFQINEISHNLNTNQYTIHGVLNNSLHNIDPEHTWVGYKIYNQTGDLLDSGKAYKNITDSQGHFEINIGTISQPNLSYKLEVYVLNKKGIQISSKVSTVSFNF